MQRHRKYDRKNQIGIAPEWQSQQGFILTQTNKELKCYYQMDDFLVVSYLFIALSISITTRIDKLMVVAFIEKELVNISQPISGKSSEH